MNKYQEIVDKMLWSYSRLAAYDHCKYEFYLNYIVANDDVYLPEGNYFAEVGSYVHKILEMIFNGELALEDASSYYVEHFDENVFYKTRKSIMYKTFETCADYFASIDFSWLGGYDILGVEKKINFNISGHPFIGFIDLLLRDKNDGKIVILDNKSSEYPFRKDGKIKVKLQDTFDKYKKQMYLYAYAVNQEYGEFPKTLMWNHFKDGGRIADIPVSKEELENVVFWAAGLIEKIKNDETYLSIIDESSETSQLKKEYWYCNNLCNFRSSCEYNSAIDWSNL